MDQTSVSRRVHSCAMASIVMGEDAYNRAGYNTVCSWEIARHQAADEGLCEHPARPDHLSSDPAIRLRARYADLLALTLELRGTYVSAVV